MLNGLRRALVGLGTSIFVLGASGAAAMYAEGVSPADVAAHMSFQRMRDSAGGLSGAGGWDDGEEWVEQGEDITLEAPSGPPVPSGASGRRGSRRWPWIVAGLLAVVGGACTLFVRTARHTSVDDGAIVLEAARRPTKSVRPKVTVQLPRRS